MADHANTAWTAGRSLPLPPHAIPGPMDAVGPGPERMDLRSMETQVIPIRRRSVALALRIAMGIVAVVGALASPAGAAQALPEDGPTYPVSDIRLRYLRDNPMHPPIEGALAIEVELGQTDTGYVAPREDVPPITLRLSDIADRPTEVYHASGIQRILEALRDYYVGQDLLGVYVAPDPTEINETGADVRARGNTTLSIIVTTGVLTEVRTVGSGERVAEGGEIEPADRINNPLHRRIIENSPIQPHSEGDLERMDLLRKSELDRYLFHLGRHPGRRVDASVAAAQDVGGIALDYMVTENRPLVIYGQVSNTGTPSTDRWRERIGLFTTQFSNNDDILGIDYTTANFDEVHAVSASYERPFTNDRVRWRVYGAYSEYDATEVGFFSDIFRGTQWSVGGEIVANIYQQRELFVDLLGGVRFENVETDNQAFGIRGEEQFLVPYLGLRLDRTTEWFSTQGSAILEWQVGDVTDVDNGELVFLGRTRPDRDWVILRYDVSHSVFLEPVLNRAAWEDPSTPESSTLAHEMRFGLKGQYAFDNRLIPQNQYVVGGLYTVRGYPESVIAGDSSIVASVEYRYHVPRAFKIQPQPREIFGEPFRAAPQYVYGTPDWDLILKGFFDVGRVIISDPLFFESDETLLGAGIGLEFLYRRNLNIRLDWGFTLDDLDSRNVNSGSNRLHVVATLLF